MRLDRWISLLLSSAIIRHTKFNSGIPKVPSPSTPRAVRVVRSEEVLDRNRYRYGELTSHSIDHEWLWVTTLSKQIFPTPVIRKLGRSRWKNENNSWMDLTNHRAFKHGFLHACRHRPKTDHRLRGAGTGLQPRPRRRHLDSSDRVRLQFGVRSQTLQTGSPGLLNWHRHRCSVTRLDLQDSAPIRAPD